MARNRREDESASVFAWRFLRLRTDRLLRTAESNRLSDARLALTLVAPHAYTDFRRAANSGTGTTVCHLRLTGVIARGRHDRLLATHHTVLWIVPASRLLRQFAVDLAEQSLLAERAAGREPDRRLWQAIEVRRARLKGDATSKEWYLAKAHAIAAHGEAVSRAKAVVVPAYNAMHARSNAWLIGVRDKGDVVVAQGAYATAEAAVAIHAAAATVLNIDAPLPKRLWRVTRDAALATAATREANRPPEARLIGDVAVATSTWGKERSLFPHYWDELYRELERRIMYAARTGD